MFSNALPRKSNFSIKLIREKLKTLQLGNFKTDAAFQGKQLSSYFNVKDKTGEFSHKRDLVYNAKFPAESCIDG